MFVGHTMLGDIKDFNFILFLSKLYCKDLHPRRDTIIPTLQRGRLHPRHAKYILVQVKHRTDKGSHHEFGPRPRLLQQECAASLRNSCCDITMLVHRLRSQHQPYLEFERHIFMLIFCLFIGTALGLKGKTYETLTRQFPLAFLI